MCRGGSLRGAETFCHAEGGWKDLGLLPLAKKNLYGAGKAAFLLTGVVG